MRHNCCVSWRDSLGGRALFRRDHHQRIALVLGALNARIQVRREQSPDVLHFELEFGLLDVELYKMYH